MNLKKEVFAGVRQKSAAVAALALLIVGSGAMRLTAHGLPATQNTEKPMNTTQSKFYCNSKALTPEERERHKQLTEKLMATRKAIVESAKGYEFQCSPADVSVAELAEWVVAESKCCPFFDFHIDLENEGKLACLRLTGEKGIKTFIRDEFQLNKVK